MLVFPIQEVGVKAGEGHRATSGAAKQIIPRRSEELDSSEGGHRWVLSPQSAESVVTPGLLPVGVKPCFQSILMHNQQGFPFQLNSYAGTLHVLSSMQILLDFPRIWADFLPWIFLYKCL